MTPAHARPVDDDSIALFLHALAHARKRQQALVLRLWDEYLDGKLSEKCLFSQIEHGTVEITPWAKRWLFESETDVKTLLARHGASDFGSITEEDIVLNRHAMKHGGWISGIYSVFPKQDIFIVTNTKQRRTVVMVGVDLWL